MTKREATRGGAVAARRAHNPKIAGSNPAPATTRTVAIHPDDYDAWTRLYRAWQQQQMSARSA